MLNSQISRCTLQHGFTLLEVLITILILAFGLLGLAAMQARIQIAEIESYQRAQAILLLSEMVDRINTNRLQATNYAPAPAPITVGTGDAQPAICVGSPGPALDICEWSNSLKGASEKSAATNVGAMVGALGCITQTQVPSNVPGVCTPGIYRVDVAWQGMQSTVTPAIACGAGSFGAQESFRRVISSTITIGQNGCV